MEPRNISRIKAALKQSHLFASLTDVQLDRVYRNSEIIRLDEGQVLFHQQQKVDNFYLVMAGKVKLFRVSPDGQEKIIELAPPGQVFAEALMFVDQPAYPVSAAALVASEVLGIDCKKFKAMLWDSPETCFLLLGAMSQRLRQLVHEIDTLTMHTGACRVAAWLIQNKPDDQNELELDIPKNVLAARLSIKPETFSRIIKSMKDDGIIHVEGNHVVVLDDDKLRDISLSGPGDTKTEFMDGHFSE